MTDYQYDNEFARTLREARGGTTYTQASVAEQIGISRAYYAGLESGSETTRKRSVIDKIADLYDLDRDALYALAPATNIRTIKERAARTKDGPPLVRRTRRLIEQTLSSADAAPFIGAAARLNVDPDDLFASFDTVPPDILDWLKADRAHIKQVRKLMEKDS